MSYKVKVKDWKGLASEETSGVTNKAKLPVPKISYSDKMGTLTDYGVYTGNESALSPETPTPASPILISSCFGKTVVLKAYNDDYPAGVTIEAEVKLSTSTPAPTGYTGPKGSSKQSGDITEILLDSIPETDEMYEVKLKAKCPNYTDSDQKTYYYKIKKEVRSGDSSWLILKKAVNLASAGDTIYIKGHIISTNAANNSGEIKVSKNINIQGSTGKTGDIIDANKDGTNPPLASHRIFRVKNGISLNLTGLTLQNGKVEGPPYEATGGAIISENGSSLTLNNTDIKNSEASNGGGGAISTGGTLTINDGSVISGNKASLGGAVYNGGTFKISGSAKITVDSGKNDVYLPEGKVITVTGNLSESAVARISPAGPYIVGRQVVEGDPTASPSITLADQVSKFKVTNDTDGKKWKINAAGQLEEDKQGKTVTTWADLKTEVENTGGAEVIIVEGTFTAGKAADEITVRRNVTIKGKDNSAALDADEKCRIFKVAKSKKLILENLTLQNGDATKLSGDKNGGAVYLNENASLEMKSVVIRDNKAKQGGGIYIANNAELLMTGGTIENNIGDGDSHSTAHGGAVYVFGTFKMSGSAKITPSAAPDEHKKGKNDVYLTSGKLIELTGTLTAGQNQAARITVPDLNYSEGRQVLTGNTDNNANKFKVTKQTSPNQEWKVGSNGYLQKK